MGESFEHRITAGGWGQSSRKMLWQHDQMKLKNTGCIQDDSQNFNGNKTELSTDEFLLFFFPTSKYSLSDSQPIFIIVMSSCDQTLFVAS